jgi:hypothetical protein
MPRIENYSILLASCAPVARLFLRAFVDHRREGRTHGYWSRSRSSDRHKHSTELKRRANAKDHWLDSSATNNTYIHDEENPATQWNGHEHERSHSRVSKAEMPEHLDDGCVTVKTDIVVQIDDGRPRSTSSGGTRLLPDGGESNSAGYR